MTSLVQSWDNVKGTASAAVTSAIGPGIESVRTVLDASDDQCPECPVLSALRCTSIFALEHREPSCPIMVHVPFIHGPQMQTLPHHDVRALEHQGTPCPVMRQCIHVVIPALTPSPFALFCINLAAFGSNNKNSLFKEGEDGSCLCSFTRFEEGREYAKRGWQEELPFVLLGLGLSWIGMGHLGNPRIAVFRLALSLGHAHMGVPYLVMTAGQPETDFGGCEKVRKVKMNILEN
eukprot:1161188-Pelagomonas_calceolata.AAC.8